MNHRAMYLCLALAAAPLAAEVASTSNRPDLLPVSIELESNGAIKAVLRNRGIEIATPFRAEVYLDVNLRRTLVFGEPERGGRLPSGPASGVFTKKNSSLNLAMPFKQGETRSFVIRDFNLGPCSGKHDLRFVADSTSTVVEVEETNNEISRAVTAPCADLAVSTIRKNWNQLHTQYVAEVIVVNKGTGTTPPFSASVQATPGVGFGMPGGGATQYGPLAPGQTLKITSGSASAIETLAVKVVLDIGNLVAESNEDNNVVSQLLRP